MPFIAIGSNSRDLSVAVDAKTILAENLHNVGHLVEKLTEDGVFHKADYFRPATKSKR
jgi:hypothetical protein